MTQTNAATAGKRKWPKILAGAFIAVLLLLVVAYFVVTSAGFFKSVVLPRAGASLNSTITVSDASISPFKQVVLKDFKLQPNGQDTLFTAGEVRVRYRLMDIIRGNINVDEIAVTAPVVTLITKPDGSSNLDPVMKSMDEPGQESGPAKPEEEPTRLNLKSLVISDAVVRMITQYEGGKQDVTEITQAKLTLDNLRNGQTGKLAFNGELAANQNPPAGTNASLQGTLQGQFDVALDEALSPSSIQGASRVQITRGQGGFASLTGLNTALEANITPTEIKQAALRFERQGVDLGQLRATGPFSLDTLEGKIFVGLQGIDKKLLNLAGADLGLDFGQTRVESTNQVTITKGGSVVAAAGSLSVLNFQVARTNQTTPSMDLRSRYDVTVDTSNSVAVLRELSVNGNQKGREVLTANLSSPMQIAWGDVSNAVGDSVFEMAAKQFNLAEWRAFLGDIAPDGLVEAKARVASQGKQLNFNFDSQITGLTVIASSNRISQLAVSARATGKAIDLASFDIQDLKFELAQGGREALTAGGKGIYNLTNDTGTFSIAAKAVLANAVNLMPMPDLDVTGGTAELNANIGYDKGKQTIDGTAAMADFNGRYGSNVFQNLGIRAEMKIAMDTNRVDINKLTGTLSSAGKPGGGFDLTGNYVLSSSAANLKIALRNLNEAALRPFLEPMLTGKQLVSVAVNADTDVQFNPAADSTIKGSLQMTNLVVREPETTVPATPLELNLRMDVGMKQEVTQIRQLTAIFTPTDRAKNEVKLEGKIDNSNTNYMQGNISLTADTLDVTRYYDLFMGDAPATETAAGQPGTGTASTTGSAEPEKEAEPMQLPMRNFQAAVRIGRFYLRELEATNVQANVTIDGAKVVVSPASFSLNGAPVKSTVNLDLSVPGYKYALDFSAIQVPFAPLVNTFTPERKGQVQGTITAVAKVSGIGTTGPNLQKHLTGDFDIGTTNLNLALTSIKSPLLRTTINVITILPDILKGGGSAASIGSLAGAIFGGNRASAGEQTGGWSGELSKSPIDVIQARGKMGSGRVDLSQALIQSPMFQAATHGEVILAPILTNSSLNFPLSVSLTRDLAQRINMVPANTPTNAVYVQLPEYVSIKGTVGEPKQQINTKALLGTALQQLGGNLGGDQKTGNLIQNLGGLLSGQRPAATNAPSGGGLPGNQAGQPSTATNAPAVTNQSASEALIQGLGGLLGKPPANQSTNSATTNRSRSRSLLNQLLQ